MIIPPCQAVNTEPLREAVASEREQRVCESQGVRFLAGDVSGDAVTYRLQAIRPELLLTAHMSKRVGGFGSGPPRCLVRSERGDPGHGMSRGGQTAL